MQSIALVPCPRCCKGSPKDVVGDLHTPQVKLCCSLCDDDKKVSKAVWTAYQFLVTEHNGEWPRPKAVFDLREKLGDQLRASKLEVFVAL